MKTSVVSGGSSPMIGLASTLKSRSLNTRQTQNPTTKSQDRSDQPRTQLFQVLQKRHSPFIFCHSYVLLKNISARKVLSCFASLNSSAPSNRLGHCDYAVNVGNVQTAWESIAIRNSPLVRDPESLLARKPLGGQWLLLRLIESAIPACASDKTPAQRSA